MKTLLLTLSLGLVLTSTAHARRVSQASGVMNRFECVYLKYGSGYTYLESVFDSQNYDLKPAQVLQGFGTWSTQGKPNYAICSTMTGTANPDRVVVQISRYSATSFNPVRDCNVSGKNVALIDSVSKEIGRGEHVDMETPFPNKPWQGLSLKVYFPTRVEVAGDLPSAADNACGSLFPR